MKKILFIGSLVMASLLYAQGSQPVEISQQDIDVQQQINIPVKAEKKESMRQWFNKIQRQYKKPDNKIFTATAAVKGQETDAQFGDYVEEAFNRAFLEVRAKQVLDNASEVATQELVDTFSTNWDSQDKENILKNKGAENLNKQKEVAKADLDKARAQMKDKLEKEKLKFNSIGEFLDSCLKGVSDEEVDNALKKQGVSNIAKLSRQEKINAFKDNYSKTIIKKGENEIMGLIPIQTRLIKKENSGAYELGLVAIVSPKTVQVAKDLREKKPSRIKGKCKSLEEQIPINDLPTIYELIGPRLYYNEKCEPVIVSFGRANFVPTSDDIRNKSLENIAEKQADIRADGYIANFINSNISTETKDQKQSIDMTNAVLSMSTTANLDENQAITAENVTGNGVTNETIRKSINYFSSKIQANSKETLTGVETFGTWDTLDEPEEAYPRVVGVVKYYASSQILKTQDFYQKLNKGVEKPATKSINNSLRKSVESYNNNTPDDF